MCRHAKIATTSREYCQNTSLHGWQYLVDDEGPARKAFWAVTILAFYIAVTVLVVQTTDDWNDQPVVTTVDTFTYPADQIQFPSITICPPIRYEKMRLEQVNVNLLRVHAFPHWVISK